ncbi:MAG: flagellar biosynthesis protein FlhB, partial [Pseudomonadota bacterium]
VMALSVLASLSVTGLLISFKPLTPDLSKLNPLSGLQRIFGTKALIELCKAIVKFVVVGGILLLQVSNHMDELLSLANMDLNQAMAIAGKLIVDACFWLAMGLVLIALADVRLLTPTLPTKMLALWNNLENGTNGAAAS